MSDAIVKYNTPICRTSVVIAKTFPERRKWAQDILVISPVKRAWIGLSPGNGTDINNLFILTIFLMCVVCLTAKTLVIKPDTDSLSGKGVLLSFLWS